MNHQLSLAHKALTLGLHEMKRSAMYAAAGCFATADLVADKASKHFRLFLALTE